VTPKKALPLRSSLVIAVLLFLPVSTLCAVSCLLSAFHSASNLNQSLF